ncbi:TRAP transporter small permease [Tropicimonas sp. IMCC34011]|uniref:TRAP transporter small permease n=1 Tax=Tropicimonas sp. IMCC34011 TaxID=2248759 RepID=UPI000E251326|nr:TRAP transporter small permease subunit [Tropicimonas sp. IMCC34011]
MINADGESADAVAHGRAPGILARISAAVARLEAWMAAAAILGVFCLLLCNVISRALGAPLIWTDELAVYLMIVGAFLGASVGIEKRQHISVTLMVDTLSERTRRLYTLVVDLLLLGFFVVLGLMLWRWFDPLGLMRAESIQAFSLETFNFLYQEPTTTLGIRKVWFWLILPVFCITGALHVLARFGRPEEMPS